jgi:ParB family transcriptional regulator, chromosome partitioning protein
MCYYGGVMMNTQANVQGKDIPIEMLVPLKERGINFTKHRGFQKITSTLQAVGLVEPLCVCKESDGYIILDGYLRYKALQKLGVTMIPCWIHKNKEAYTYNRMVNRLSAVQQSRMLHQSLHTLDRKTIQQAFGITSLEYRLATGIINQLHANVVKAVDKEILSRRCATEFANVNLDRQAQILKEMNRTNDHSISFARALIVKTPPEMRSTRSNSKKPWAGNSEKKKQLVAKLEEIQKRYDFYTSLYRQYSTDLLRLCIYVRRLITNEAIAAHLESNFPELLKRFQMIVFNTEGKKASA